MLADACMLYLCTGCQVCGVGSLFFVSEGPRLMNLINLFINITAVPFWGQITRNLSVFVPNSRVRSKKVDTLTPRKLVF